MHPLMDVSLLPWRKRGYRLKADRFHMDGVVSFIQNARVILGCQ
jgi:hypothetical protein